MIWVTLPRLEPLFAVVSGHGAAEDGSQGRAVSAVGSRAIYRPRNQAPGHTRLRRTRGRPGESLLQRRNAQVEPFQDFRAKNV